MAQTPVHNWKSLDLYQGRTNDFTFTIYKEDGDEFALAAGDVVRFKLWKTPSGNASAPALDIDSVGASANGSVVTVDTVGVDGTTAAQVTVRFAQGDTSGLDVAEYAGELSQVDDSETAPVDAIKVISTGPVQVIGLSTGDLAKA